MTSYHAKYFAHELTKRCPSDSVEKLASALSNAQVDLNPHQIEAALFAFRSPLSKGAILADEVGLGKTIERGFCSPKKWARLLVICPANLRKQWSEELAEKFFLPSTIRETRTFNGAIRAGNLNPFQCDAAVIVLTNSHVPRSPTSGPRSETAFKRRGRGSEQQGRSHHEKILWVPNLPNVGTRSLSLTWKAPGARLNPRFF
jgi:hypothetical protein